MWPNSVDFQLGKMFTIFLILLLLIDISENLIIRRQPVEQGLYTVNDSVIILTIDNFKEQIYGRNRACLVEFYSSWCGHCVRYAPIWKAFGRDVEHWQDIAAVGVIDCSNEANGPICTNFEIYKYPTLLYFHEKYVEGQQNLGDPVPIGPDFNDNRNNFIALLIKDQANGKGSVFPNLQLYHDSDISNIFNTSTGMPKYAFLIVQDPSNFVGAEITMDFHKISDVMVRYSYNNNTQLLKNLNVNSNFALVVIERDYISTVLLSSTFLNRTTLKESLKQFLVLNLVNVDNIDKSNSSKLLTTRIDVSPGKKTEDAVFLGDLENALRFSMKQEVGRVKQITGERLEALKNYVNVLMKYFPFGINGKFLLQQIMNLTSENTVSGKKISQMIAEAEQPGKEVFTTPFQWIACQGSAVHFRGYPCGLWTMFHYLTVNGNNENNNHNYSNEVLKAMHGYISNYFGCWECRVHFQEMARDRDHSLFNVTSYDDSVLWLWRAHNKVNQRLSGDMTEDPQHPKIQFPSESNCPQCYRGKTWNEGEVLQYLKQMYGRDNVYPNNIPRTHTYALKTNAPTNTSGVPFRTYTNFMILITSALAILRTIYLL